MSFSTFSGPLRAGTVRFGTVANGRNTGLVALTQSYDTGDLTGTIVSNVDGLRFVLPQGSQILNIFVDQVVAATAGTTTVSVGTTSGGAELMAAVATTAGGRFQGTATATTQLAWQTSTTADTNVFVRVAVATATLTAGRLIVSIIYAQRAADGTQNPAPASV
jgi:hypothetical protein